MSRTLVGLLLVLIAFSSEVVADQVTLKNGDRVTGKIVTSDGTKVIVKSDLIGEVTILFASVETITTDAQLSLLSPLVARCRVSFRLQEPGRGSDQQRCDRS